MTYDQWDAIADAVNPVMAIVTLLVPFFIRSGYRGGRRAFYLALASSMATMYALGWIDARQNIWASWGMDYSTHTGFAVVLVASLWLWARPVGLSAGAVAIAYAGLMLYQGYHSLADIALTGAIVCALTLGIQALRTAMLRGDARSGDAPTP